MRKRCGLFPGLIRSRPKCSQKKLDVLVMKRPIGKRKWATAKKPRKRRMSRVPPGKKDLPAVQCITKAIQDELHAINKYQRYMNDAEEPRVKELFCHLMNEEKSTSQNLPPHYSG